MNHSTEQAIDTILTVESIVTDAPIGSRVGFFNTLINSDELDISTYNALLPHKFENTMKVGNDQYAAHGLGITRIFTSHELKLKMVATVRERVPNIQVNIDNDIFISEIEYINENFPN